MTNEIPEPKAIFEQYLADNATDAKGKKYVFDSDGEPDHFKLLECVLADIGEPGRHEEDEEFAANVDEACVRAADIYNAQFNTDDE